MQRRHVPRRRREQDRHAHVGMRRRYGVARSLAPPAPGPLGPFPRCSGGYRLRNARLVAQLVIGAALAAGIVALAAAPAAAHATLTGTNPTQSQLFASGKPP